MGAGRKMLAMVAVAGMAAGLMGADVPRKAVDPGADALLKQMAGVLAGAKTFKVETHAIMEQLLPTGQKVEVGANQKAEVRRPDGIHVAMTGDQGGWELTYDGKKVVMADTGAKVYTEFAGAATIDETLDLLAEKHHVVFPLADLILSDPYKALAGKVKMGEDLGTGWVFETRCRHLAFRAEAVDWQVWIEEGAKPLPRKLVITYKDSPAYLTYTVYLSKWELDGKVGPMEAVAPAGAVKMESVPATQPGIR